MRQNDVYKKACATHPQERGRFIFLRYSLGVTNIPPPPQIYCTMQFDDTEARGVYDYIKERTIQIGRSIVHTKQTVRTIAQQFGVSKSTVHKDLTERLPLLDAELAENVKEILEYHKSIRHLRGGEATKQKYKKPASS